MTENNISDRGGLESRYTADAIDVIIRWHPKLAELYEAEADKKRLLDMFLATFEPTEGYNPTQLRFGR